MQKTEDAIKIGEDLFFDRKFGIDRIKKELEKRQFSSNVIEEAIKRLNPGYEERHIKQIILGKYGRRLFIDHEKEKIIKMLIRLGYHEAQTKNVLELLEQEEF
ncbi:MAG: RecX family transcriptional regulator [Oscillospiraceae bacterium]|nr:RecX family transcriptional regulator [Oscillospiraceae bacterium]